MRTTTRTISDKFNHITSLNRRRYVIAAVVAMALVVMGNSCSNGFVENARLPVDAQKTCEASIAPCLQLPKLAKAAQ